MASADKTSQKENGNRHRQGNKNAGQSKKAQATTSAPKNSTSTQGKADKRSNQQAPALELWKCQNVVFRRVPDMSNDVFCKNMLVDQSFCKAEHLSIHASVTGTFASINICRRYWEAVKAAGPEFPFSLFVGNSPIQKVGEAGDCFNPEPSYSWQRHRHLLEVVLYCSEVSNSHPQQLQLVDWQVVGRCEV